MEELRRPRRSLTAGATPGARQPPSPAQRDLLDLPGGQLKLTLALGHVWSPGTGQYLTELAGTQPVREDVAEATGLQETVVDEVVVSAERRAFADDVTMYIAPVGPAEKGELAGGVGAGRRPLRARRVVVHERGSEQIFIFCRCERMSGAPRPGEGTRQAGGHVGATRSPPAQGRASAVLLAGPTASKHGGAERLLLRPRLRRWI